jgi:lambda family phage portal protein
VASIQQLRQLYQQANPSASVIAPPSISASSSGAAYDAASSSRRLGGFSPTRSGPTVSLWSTLDLMRARCRDEVRNNPYAASAVDNFEAQTVGDGIFPHWNLSDAALKSKIEKSFAQWCKRVRFYALQATAAREIFEAGEVLLRFHIRPSSWNLRIPLDLQLLEGEQLPVFLNQINAGGQTVLGSSANQIRTGIEFDPSGRCVAYHLYRQHPGETGLFPMDGLSYMRVPASEVLHCFKPLRAGLLRGQPHLAAALTLLHEVGKYTDAAVVKKQIQTMFAGFIQKVDPVQDILPPDVTGTGADSQPPAVPPLSSGDSGWDVGVGASKIETGTMQVLYPNETITFPQLPQDSDIETFLSVMLHQFAASIGATYEQITGDLRHVNLSSIRYGVQVMQRKCTQFVRNVLVTQFIEPVAIRWLQEAVLAGELTLPGYAANPEKYADIDWKLPGWPYMDPLVESQASVMRVRGGLSSREKELGAIGGDAATIDAQNERDQEREDKLHLVYASNASRLLERGQTLTADAEKDTGGVAKVKPPLPGANPDGAQPAQSSPPAGKPNGKPAGAKPN